MFTLNYKRNLSTYLIYFMKENLFNTASYLDNTNINDTSIFNITIDSMNILNNTVGTVIYIENKKATDDFRLSEPSDILDFSGKFDVISKFTPQKKFKSRIKIKAINKLNTKVIL